jgi:hypothetical protein
MRYRRVREIWEQAMGRTLTDAQLDLFYHRDEDVIDALANTPEAILRETASAIVADTGGASLKLDRWLADARQLYNQRQTLGVTGRRAREQRTYYEERHVPADRDLHRMISQRLGDVGVERE